MAEIFMQMRSWIYPDWIIRNSYLLMDVITQYDKTSYMNSQERPQDLNIKK